MIIPPYLKAGDKLGIVSPAGRIDEKLVLDAVQTIENWGLEVVLGKYVFGQHFQYASNDENRLSDLQAMLDNPGLKSIICSRGGYGAIRIIDSLNFEKFIQHPKWLVGFSDITLLHAHLNHRLNCCSIHGPMAKTLATDPFGESTLSLKKALFGENLFYEIPHNLYNKRGKARGKLIGETLPY